MNHKIKSKRSFVTIVLLIFISLSIYYIPRILFDIGNKGGAQCSGSITKSKELGVFIAEYRLGEDFIVLSDSVKFKPGEIWIEKTWNSKDYDNPVQIVNNRYNLYLELPSENIEAIKKTMRNNFFSIINTETNEQLGILGLGKKHLLSGDYYNKDELPERDETISVILADSSEDTFIPEKWKIFTVIDSFSIIKQ